ncbi:MAG: sulfotransferase [Deltaproteobacteria bacterium]|nr:sulfotransferase [Deltaproteobacteria bacterium]
MAEAKKPNFFIVGAAKSGTTSLADNLKQHPEVFISPVKEPFYFVSDYGLKDFDSYLSLFKKAGDAKAIGEASTGYLFDGSAASSIKKAFPDSRIIIILRNPADMAFSYWKYMLIIGNESKSFEEAINKKEREYRKTEDFKRKCVNWWASYIYLERAMYSEQVKRFFDIFGSDRVRVCIFEDFIKRPEEYYTDIFHFIGVDENFVPKLSIRNEGGEVKYQFLKNIINNKHTFLKKFFCKGVREKMRLFFLDVNTKKIRSKMDPNTRELLNVFFKDDIKELESLLGREIEAWRSK